MGKSVVSYFTNQNRDESVKTTGDCSVTSV